MSDGTVIVCDRCTVDQPCPEHAEYVLVRMTQAHSHGMRWDPDGRCFERVNDGPEKRRPDYDFGTPAGDLLIEPWVQDAIEGK